jgi:hypothetical protein
VAIKVLPESLTSDPDRLRRFEREARAVAALNHPNILTVYDVGYALRLAPGRLRQALDPVHQSMEPGEEGRSRLTARTSPRLKRLARLLHTPTRDPASGPRLAREAPMARRLMSWLSIASGFALLSPLPVQAQSLEESLPTGARVRVTLASETGAPGTGPRLTGRLAKTRPGSITLATNGSETREVRRDAIVRLERSIRPSRKVRGALIGYALGFVTLGVTAGVMGTEGACYDMAVAECVAFSALLALPAAAVGAIIAPGEQWADVPLGIRSRGTAARGAGLQLRVVPLVGRRSGLAVVASF